MAKKAPVIEVQGRGKELLPPPVKRPSKWWVVAGLFLILVLMAGGYNWFLARQAPRPAVMTQVKPGETSGPQTIGAVIMAKAVSTNLPAAVTGLVASVVKPGVIVKPEPPRAGAIRVKVTAPEYTATFLAGTSKRLRFETNTWQTVQSFPFTLPSIPCGPCRVRLEVDGFSCSTLTGANDTTALVDSDRTNEVEFVLTPRPAALTLSCNVTQALAQVSSLKSQVSSPLSLPSLQSLTLTVSAPGYRSQALKLDALLPGATEHREVTLEREIGSLLIEATVPSNAAAYFQRMEKRFQTGSNAWVVVPELPHVVDGLACAAQLVELHADGFEVARGVPSEPQVRDGQTTTVTFAVTPRPATLTVSCNITNAVLQITNQQSQVGNPLSVPSLRPFVFTVSATGYVSQVVKVAALEPGKPYRQEVRLERPRGVEVGQNARIDELGLDLVWVDASRFQMGAQGRSDADTNRAVWISRGYWIGKTEVTQNQYESLTGKNPSHWKRADLPVEGVSWDDAVRYCKLLTEREHLAGRVPQGYEYRLPTEAEWEFSARGGVRSRGTRYSGGDRLEDVAVAPRDAMDSVSLQPVGTKAANELGIHDMSGNVWEWCLDWYVDNPDKAAGVDPSGPDKGSGHVVRGGSWYGSSSFCRVTSRFNGTPLRSLDVGFRVVLAPSQFFAAPTADGNGKQMTVDLGGGVKLELVWIPPGDFLMGSEVGSKESEAYGHERDEGPQHRVRITKGFWMGKYEVTQAQWHQVMGSNPSHFKGGNLPVERVSWTDCQKFLKKMNLKVRIQKPEGGQFRLPTEAEWEYACRAGTTTRFYSGDSEADLELAGWYKNSNSEATTHPVGQKRANSYGLYDMHGNVSEWCSDWYGNYESAGVTDPTGPASGQTRVYRGGYYTVYSYGCQASYRTCINYPDYAYNYIGFRVALPAGQ